MVEKLEFICNHPELVPTMWGQEKPPPTKTIGPCEHNMICPTCGWGWGGAPDPCENDGFIVNAHIYRELAKR